jgi:uncharacterized protein (TIGR01319 family)
MSVGASSSTTGHAVICVDFGSTFTKAALVDLDTGRMVASAAHRTTIETDVMDGYDACRARLTDQDPRAASAEVFACSSAGGGLRIAVLGNEELVTAEAGRRVALSSGGKVVGVLATSSGHGMDDLRAADPDVVLLTGGTDHGNPVPIRGWAEALVAASWSGPVVVAGNRDADAGGILTAGGVPHVVADNVLPRIGVLAPGGARAAIREVFLSHVIGGKHLSKRADFLGMVRGSTPDVVLTGVELLARGLDTAQPGVGDVVVVDVGGATTDVYIVVDLDSGGSGAPDSVPGNSPLSRDVVANTPVTRTVEGDLGMRWSAIGTIEAARIPEYAEAAAARAADPGYLPHSRAERAADEAIAAAAVTVALRRHAGRSRVVLSPEGRVVERAGTNLREVRLVVGSGGVFRHGRTGVADRIFAASIGSDIDGGWQLPQNPRVIIDRDYVLAAAGLLVAEHPQAAYKITRHLDQRSR